MRVILKNENEIKSNTPTTIIVNREGYQKPATGISKTDLEQTIQTSLGRADSAYQKPVDGIPSTDLASGVIPAPEVFWATYGQTTAAEIDAAVAEGKLPVVVYNGKLYVYSNNTTTNVLFTNTYLGQLHRVQIDKATGTWDNFYINAEQQSNKKSTITGNESSTIFYPSTKAVADYVAAQIGSINDILDEINGEEL